MALSGRLQARSLAYLRDQLGLPWPDELAMPVLEDGVYLNLPEELYFGQGAMGSTDWSDLWLYRHGWWFKSRHNPWRKPDDSSKAKLFGSAAHTLLLEGPVAFEERWAVEPDPRHFPDLLVTRDEVYSALEEIEAPGLRRTMRNKDLFDLGGVYLPERHIWPLIIERFDRKIGDKEKVSAEDKWVLDIMRQAALDDPEMRKVVSSDGGVALTEVSVFWTLDDGTRMRFRFDTLLPTINGDLKTIGNVRDRELSVGIGKRITGSALDVQAALSFEARRVLYAHVRAGRVHGGTRKQQAWLARFPDEAPIAVNGQPAWAWLWLFYQKPDFEGHAPVILPVWMRFASVEHAKGWDKFEAALAFFRAQRDAVGLDKPWTVVEPIHYYDTKASARRVEGPMWAEEAPPSTRTAQALAITSDKPSL